MESDLLFPLNLDHELDFGGLGGLAMDDLMNEANFDMLPLIGMEETQAPVVIPQTVQAEGIQATDVNSLFERFEEAAASQSMDVNELHSVADGTPLKSQSLPASRVCSTANSPATTPPTTPPPDVLHKLRSRQSQVQKRKSTIMLPLGAPAKRGRGQATRLEMSGSSGSSSKLQKILSRNQSASASRSESPVGFQPVQPAGVEPSGLQTIQPQAISVKFAAASNPPFANLVASSAVSSSCLGQVTDPAVAQSILSKTPRALSVLTAPIGFEKAAARSEPRATKTRSSSQHSSVPPPLVISKPGNLKNDTEPVIAPKHLAKQPSSTSPLSQTTAAECDAATTALRDGLAQPVTDSPAHPSNRRPDEYPKRNNIVVSRGAEKIQPECLDSVLDHDYCRDSLRRVIVDDFDLVVSPTRSHCQKPVHEAKSLPVIKADSASALQASSLHRKKAAEGQMDAAALLTSSSRVLPVSAAAVTGSSSQGVKNSDVVNAAAAASQVAASAPNAAVQNPNKPSSHPMPVLDLMSILKNVQNIQNLFTLENGTLKLHPSVTAGMDPAAQLTSLASQNTHQATSDSSSGKAASISGIDVGTNVGRLLQQTAATPVVPLKAQNPQQTPQSQAVVIASSVNFVAEDSVVRKQQMRSASATAPAEIQHSQQFVPVQSSSAVSESSELSKVMLQKQSNLSQLPNMLQPSHAESAKTAMDIATSKHHSELPLQSNGTSSEGSGRYSPAQGQWLETLPPHAQCEDSPNLCKSHSKQAMSVSSEKMVSPSSSANTPSLCHVPNPGNCTAHTLGNHHEDAKELEKPAPLQEASNPVINRTSHADTDYIQPSPHATEDDLGNQTLYSMPQFDVEEPPSTDVSERVVAPIESHSHQKVNDVERCHPSSPSPRPLPHETCDGAEPLQPSPLTPPATGHEERPHSRSPYDFPMSPEAGTSHQEDSQHFTDDFTRVWEEHSLNAEVDRLFKIRENHNTVTSSNRTVPSSPDQHTRVSDKTSSSKRSRPSRRYRQGRNWKPGNSPVREDNSGLFNKIPTYYTALSIPTKTGRKQLTAEVAEGMSINDFLPTDRSPHRNSEKDVLYDKMPPYFSCFTNSTKYDEMAPKANFNPSSERGEPEKPVSSSAGQLNYTNSRSLRRSASKSPSPARSGRSVRSRDGKRLHKRRRSNSSSASSRSGSRTRSWRNDRRRGRKSPSLSGSSRSSSRSRSRSHSSSRSWSRSGSRYSHSSSRSRSRSRSHSSSRSRGRRNRSRSRESQGHSGSREHRHEQISKERQMRKAQRREMKIKKMEERKIVYVGRIPDGYTRRQLYKRFEPYGKIEEVSVHFREAGDNYGFVTYYNPQDAFRAIDKGNSAPNERHFDLCFGGRRHFCANEYADLDGNLVIEEEYAPTSAKNPTDFDELLKQAQRKLKKK